jgi:hypothetical protein
MNRGVGRTDDLEQIESKLKAALPVGWYLTREGDTLQLTRTQKLLIYSSVQMDVGQSLDNWAKNTGVELTYRITLRFTPLITREQYAQLKAERAPFEKIVNDGAGTINEWERGLEEFVKRQVPVYFTDRYTIYAEKTDKFPDRVYPESAGSECKEVIASLDKLFNRYEPWSGKNSDFQVRT